jgi:hypothetical protein
MQIIFPVLLAVLDFGAAIVYLTQGDIKRGIYWVAAATLTICVTL